ncbi:hypothetical protein [Clostridium sp. YIM B02555]|uniref:GTP pyrophosphokinase n=1 Tax=Clostridium sp. YIM B02555 TaxID=2911968 RepID=UPI001EEF3397|nr:hypothetical protein [Clostridium sp. YIM B02555]
MKEEILFEYREKYNLYLEFSNVIINLLTQVLKSIPTQQISGRVKEYNSLEEKIELKNKYQRLDDITDIIGIRIITYLPNNVDKISEIIKKEFEIDKDNCIDKRIKKDDEFGYMSLHLVCKLDDKRLLLPEYRRFENVKFEVQIRSVLQHTWAEIEHDIGYKSKVEIPQEFRRRLYRLASLLESADDEFQTIVDKMEKYNKYVKENVHNKNMELDINKNTLIEYFKKSKELYYILENVAKGCGKGYNKKVYLTLDYIKWLNYFKYSSIKDVDADIRELKEIIIKFAINYLKKFSQSRNSSLTIAVGIHYLIYLKLAQCNEEMQKGFVKAFFANDIDRINKIKEAYLNTEDK